MSANEDKQVSTIGTRVAPAVPEVPPLRLFVVYRSTDPKDTVMVQAHQVGSNDGTLEFSTFKMAPDNTGYYSYTHRMFKQWVDMEEIFSAPSSGMVN